MTDTVDLSIIIVAWNVRDLVLDCLASIQDAKLGIPYEVIVVDNGSVDETPAAVARQFPETRVVALPGNIGFGAGNNRGLERMRGRHAVLLNSDTIVLPGGLERCVAYLDAHPEVGVVGPQLLNPDRTKQNCIHNSPTLLSEIVGQSLLRYGLSEMRRAGADVAVTYGDPAYYRKVGFRPVTTETIPAPRRLQYPAGWQAQSLTDAPLAPITGPLHCVQAIDDPVYW